jgi:tetratricopeptide (TPR) repeat protein
VLLFALGRVNIAKGRYRDAEHLLKRALLIEEATYGPDHKNIGAVLSLLALTLMRQKRPSEAELLFKRVLAIYTEKLGADHPATVQVLRDLATLYTDLGRQVDANALFEAPRSDDDIAKEALPMFLDWLSRFHHRKNYQNYAAAIEFWIRYDAGKHVLANRYEAFGLFCKRVIESGEATGGLLVRLDADNVAHVPRGSTNAPFLDLAAFNAAVEYTLSSEKF